MAINFLIHNQENDDMYAKGMKILDTLSQWIKTLSKAIGKHRQQHGLRVQDALANKEPTKATSEFLKNINLQAKVDTAILNLSSSFDLKMSNYI